jgi:choline-sulfatase
MSDEHNRWVSSVYGHARVVTPHMERLAAAGTVFTDAYCPSPLCMPSRSALMAGLPVHQVQAYNNCNIIPRTFPSYGEVLARQGVYTAYIGNVDVYDHSSTLGFSEMMLAGDRRPPGDVNISRTPLAIRAGAPLRAKGYGPREHAFASDRKIIDRAVEWLTHTAPRLNRPWTLTVNIGAPHFPHYVSRELWEMYADATYPLTT